MSLVNKRIILGVTGGIAAYKSAEIVRKLQELGADVKVVMTKGAQEFITPLTLQALSGNPVHTDLLDPAAEAAMGHIELARWADVILIAPATANFMSLLVSGSGSDLLTTLCLANSSKIAIAPAMNQAMWADTATQENLKVLHQRGISVFGPAAGEQACGDVGLGRMLEPVDIAQKVEALFASGALSGRHVVITAGPTREAIDPVRYISNHSSGKMGYALAQAALEVDARVTLISGPVNLSPPDRVSVVRVESALDMHSAVHEVIDSADIFIGAAAVADFRPEEIKNQKIKKSSDDDTMQLSLIKNPDIIASVAQLDDKPFVVGFAAETEMVEEHARAKLSRKKLDMIIANDVSQAGIGFNSDKNAVAVIDSAAITQFPENSKAQLARDLVNHIAKKLNPEREL